MSHPSTRSPSPRQLDQVREIIRIKHYSIRTEQAYLQWIKRYIIFHGKRHPRALGADELTTFLSDLAIRGKVSASTQNQALNAILFLYREVLRIELPWLNGVQRAKRSQHLPVVLTRQEVKGLLAQLEGTIWLMACITYGGGLRLLECLRLRVKDLDLDRCELTVRDGKGQKDRVTVLPRTLVEPVRTHLARVRQLHERDIADGFGRVYLPFALDRKYPNASLEWGWQYVFPAARRSTDPRSGMERRHHVNPEVLQRAVKNAVRKAHIIKPASVHTLRHSCHASARLRVRHPNCAGAVGARGCENYDDLHARPESRWARCRQPDRSGLTCLPALGKASLPTLVGRLRGLRTRNAKDRTAGLERCIVA